MKKFYVTALMLMGGVGLSYGQSSNNNPLVPIAGVQEKAAPQLQKGDISAPLGVPTQLTSTSSSRAAGDVLWSEDFSSGTIPTGWTLATTPTGADWIWTTNAPYGQYTGEPAIASTTGTTGFMQLNTDGFNTGTTNFQAITASFTTTDITVSPTVGVNLEFQHYFRPFTNAELLVGWSTDGGSTWNEVDVRDGVSTNSASANPVTKTMYLGTVPSGTIRLRFKWANESHYFWMVDDIKLIEAPQNNLEISDIFFKGIADTNGLNAYYSQIPLSQVTNDSMWFGGTAQSVGSVDQPNARFDVSISGPNTSDVVSTPGGNTVSGGNYYSDEVVPTNYYFTDGGQGTFTYTFTAVSDSTEFSPANNSKSWDINVGDSVYARDDGDIEYVTRRVEGEILAPVYIMNNSDVVTSVDVYIGDPTSFPNQSVGSVVSVYLYDNSFNIVESNTYYTIQQADAGSWVTFDLDDTPVTAGAYLIGFEVISDTCWIGIDDREPEYFQIYENIGGSLGTGGTWYYANFNNVPYIRMNVEGLNCPTITSQTQITQSPTCGAADGAAQVVPVGGQSPYLYEWPDGTTTPTNSGLAAGNYEVTITDNNLCSSVVTVTLGNANAPTVSAGSNMDTAIACYGDCDGVIDIDVAGGTGNIAYFWNDSSTTEDLSGLCAGSYAVTITDDANCITYFSASVTEPGSAVTGTASSTINTNSASATATGGTPPYTYSWTSSSGGTATGANPTGLDPGTWNLVITDANGCTSDVITVEVLVSVAEHSLNNSVSVFPNPTSGVLNVRLQDVQSGAYTMTLQNVIGQTIDMKKVNVTGNYQTEFNMNGMEKGIYFLRMENELNETGVFKIVLN